MRNFKLIIFFLSIAQTMFSQQQEVPDDEERGCLNSDYIEIKKRSTDGNFDEVIVINNYTFCAGINYQFEYTYPSLASLNQALVFTIERFQGINANPQYITVHSESFIPPHTLGAIKFQYSFNTSGYFRVSLKFHNYDAVTGLIDPIGNGNDITSITVFEDANYTVWVDNTPNPGSDCYSIHLQSTYPDIYHGPCDGDPAHAGWYRNLYVNWGDGANPQSVYNSSVGPHANPLYPLTTTYNAAGYYTLHFYEQTTCQGDPFYNDKYFTIWAGPPQVFLNATQPYICKTLNNTTTITATVNSNGNDTYAWSSSDGSVNATGVSSINVTPTSTTTYTISVTDFNGCETVESYTVYVENCCSGSSAEETFFSDPHQPIELSTMPSVYFTNNINQVALNGTYKVSGQALIENCSNIQLSSNAKIIVESGGLLTINNSHLQSCGNMWAGIEVMDGGEIEIINGSIIEDALQAVSLQSASGYYVDGVVFNDNLHSVFSAGCGNGTITNSSFSNTSSTLLPPHAGRPSECGIEAWTTDIEIGPGNVFDGLRTGIKLWLTNANIYECTFQNLVTDPLNQFYTGVGIYAQGDFGIGNPAFAQYGLNVYGMGKDAAMPNFSNLRTGIMLRNMNAKTITENYMSGVAFGIRAQLCHGASLNFDRNRYANVSNTGVLLSNNIGADAKIFESNFTGQKQFVEPTGVHVEGFGNKESNLVIGLNRFDRFTYGVRMNKVSGPDDYMESLGAIVWNNDFYSTLSGLANNIHLTACSRLAIDENYIEGKAAAATTNPNSAAATDKQYGIFLQNTTDYQLRCNNFDNLSSAIYAYGSNPTGKDNITTNQMHRHYYGWNMRRFGLDGELGTIGSQQFGNRNDFNDGLSNYHTGVQIWGHNNIAHLPNTIYRLTQDGLASVSSNNGNLPFNLIQAQGSLGECVSIPEGDLEFLIDDENMYEELQAIEVVNGYLTQTADPAFQGVIDFEAKRRIYKTLEQDTTLMQSSATLSDFYNQSRFQTLGKLREIEKELALLSDTAVLQDSVQVISIRQSIRSKRQSITGVSTHEANEKQMLALFEEKVLNADDRFTTEEQQLIASLAHQCPLVAGNGVYLARSLYSLFAEDNEFNDGVICDGYYKKESSFVEQNTITEPTLHIFPNPANKLALFVYYLPSTMTGYNEISLYTMEGRKLFAQSVLTGGSSIAFDVSNLANGLYLVEFRNGNSVVRSEKLSVNH